MNDLTEDTARIKDQLGKNPETFPVLNADYSEAAIIEEGPIQVSTENIGHSLTFGHATNGVIGTADGIDASQLEMGNSSRVETIQRVVNSNKRFIERFNFTLFNEDGTTTGDWTGDGSLVLTNGEIAQSTSVALNDGNITNATITVTLSSGDIADLTLFMDADDSGFETAENTVNLVFEGAGVDLKWKIVAAGNVTVDSVVITYG